MDYLNKFSSHLPYKLIAQEKVMVIKAIAPKHLVIMGLAY